ncbi:hypothetical protein GXP67_19530 [Rhodocytophaga rosea]|uniref:Uncharacterized protein n=1 Tax=Rhodocytophaga rosea TaxID=2704465 RepID=A0A6C0GKZ1_9BACT|nr:hypothetical protein [Rhodocytophaga rosea]QHT68678.1 hypothetical protein GXP67_19530 [Rhodocytophaga rosea]
MKALVLYLLIYFGFLTGNFFLKNNFTDKKNYALCDQLDIANIKEDATAKSFPYSTRENACEGIYNYRARGGLSVVGLYRGDLLINEKNTNIEILPDIGVPNQIKIRAANVSVGDKHNYRLDAEISNGNSFLWDISKYLIPSGFTSNQIKIYGWLSNTGYRNVFERVSSEDIFYVPIVLNKKYDGDLQLYIRTVRDIKQIEYKVYKDDGSPIYTKKKSVESINRGKPIIIKIQSDWKNNRIVCINIIAYSNLGPEKIKVPIVFSTI